MQWLFAFTAPDWSLAYPGVDLAIGLRNGVRIEKKSITHTYWTEDVVHTIHPDYEAQLPICGILGLN